MALRAVLTTRDVSGKGDGSAIQVIWAGPALTTDTFAAVELPKSSDKSIHVFGTFGAAGSVALHGSNNDGANFDALNTPASTPIAITANGIKAVLENTQQVKPVLTGGDGTTSLTVAMLFHFSNPARQ